MLEEQNLWWKGAEYISEDEDFSKWAKSKIKWVPSLLQKIELDPYSMHFIFGPRQVGKTTLVKLLIKKLLDKGINPKAIFYFKCDQLTDFKELDEVLKRYLELKELTGIKTSFIFLDEITFPKDWFRAIKWHIDMGHFRADVLVLTGSLSMFVKGETETFPGRRGKGQDFIMWPLSFREVLAVARPEIVKKIEAAESLDAEEIKAKCLKAAPWAKEIRSLFSTYIECGGFPLALKSMLEEKKIPAEIASTYLSWIRGDLAKLKRSESIAKRILKAIVEKVPSTVSWHGLAKEFEIKSHKTVFYYIDIFEKLFLAKVLYFIDPNKGVEIFYKQRKVHLIDPFLYTIFADWCFTKKPESSVIVESIVASHLARKTYIGYWRNSRELDIILPAFRLGIEVKYGERPEFRQLAVGKIKKVLMLTKEKFSDKQAAIPISLFLACLDC